MARGPRATVFGSRGSGSRFRANPPCKIMGRARARCFYWSAARALQDRCKLGHISSGLSLPQKANKLHVVSARGAPGRAPLPLKWELPRPTLVCTKRVDYVNFFVFIQWPGKLWFVYTDKRLEYESWLGQPRFIYIDNCHTYERCLCQLRYLYND
jgi:hypothetical protein